MTLNTKKPRSRESGRQIRRKAVEFAISTDQLAKPRKFLSDEQAAAIFQDIKLNKTAKFGLVRLSALQLNERYVVAVYYHNEMAVTFLEFAVLYKRDAIVASLLRAGATAADLSLQSKNDLWTSSSPAYAVWLVSHAISMYCVIGKADLSDCMVPSCAHNSEDRLGRWPGCGHVHCSRCVWNHLINTTPKWEFTCPTCQIYQPDDLRPPLVSNHSPEELKSKSLQMFNQLPTELVNPSSFRKPKFHRLSRYDVACILPGLTQGKRMEKFWIAIMNNDLLRVQFLVRQGVDIDEKNEYGQSGIFMASWRGYLSIVKFLADSGADVNTCDNMRTSCLQVAYLRNHQDIVSFLLKMQDKAPDGLFPFESNSFDRISASLSVTSLIPSSSDHIGAGACYIDNAFSLQFLRKLQELCSSILPVPCPDNNGNKLCSQRSYLCDSTGWIIRAVESVLSQCFHEKKVRSVLPFMRFLNYEHKGGFLPPHVDLSRTDFNGRISTHTLILYLDDCQNGGETALLTKIPPITNENSDQSFVIAAVKPKFGRLLLFPHQCPHEGREIVDLPKTLLRGEIILI